MTHPDARNGSSAKPTIAELEAQIAKARLELTSTVDEFSDRVDPRTKIAEAKARLQDLVATARARATALKDDAFSGDPKSIGVLAAGVASLGIVIAVSIRRR